MLKLFLLLLLTFATVSCSSSPAAGASEDISIVPLEKSLFPGSPDLNTLAEGDEHYGIGNASTRRARNQSHSSFEEGYEGPEEEKMERFPVFTIDFARVQTPLIIGLWLFCACLGKIAFHMTPKLSTMFPESCMLIMMGLIIGGIFVYANPNPESQVSPLTADIFFLYLLPPIILDAGYFMPNRLFFDHLGTILTFAVIGTIWNAMTIGISLYALTLTGIFGPPEDFPMLHIFLFASLISAVDPVAVLAVFEEIHVEEVLFILVFGESLLNDGVTVVLYHMFEGFSELGEDNLQVVDICSGIVSFFLVALGGTAIGVLWGFLTAFVTRFTYQVRVIEPIFVYIMSYLAYLNAELFHWSGILAITFCGITMKNYTERNISNKSQTTIKYSMKMLASSSETVIFLFLGVATVHGTQHDFNLWFVFFTILFCTVYRVLGVLIFSALCNRFRVQKIDFVQKFVMCYGGLRGAVAFALAITIDPHHIPLAPTFVTTCIAVVFFTVFVQGMTIKPVVDKLGVKKASKRDLSMNERLHERSMDYVVSGLEEIVGKFSSHGLRSWFKRIHQRYLVPALVHKSNAKEPKLFETLSRLRMQDAMNYMDNTRETPKVEMDSFAQTLQANLYTTPTAKEWNLDVDAIDYNPGDKDINEARFHHLLSDEYHQVKKRRQSTYKRHAVQDKDLETSTDFRQKMVATARQVAMTSIRRRTLKNREREANKLQQVNRPITQNGSSIRLRDDYLEETVRSRDNPTFIDDEGLFLTKLPDDTDSPKLIMKKKWQSTKGPSVAETFLPWKRFLEPDIEGEKQQNHAAHFKRQSTSHSLIGSDAQTMAESVLPWKRAVEDDDESEPRRQTEFPAWATNRDCDGFYSPSNTILGNIDEANKTSRPKVMDLFSKQPSSASLYSSRTSLKETMPTLRESARDSVSYQRRSSIQDPLRKRHSSRSLFSDMQRQNYDSDGSQDTTTSAVGFTKSSIDRRGSRDIIADNVDSLLNTVIDEDLEEAAWDTHSIQAATHLNGKDKSPTLPSRTDHSVVDMDPPPDKKVLFDTSF